MMPTFENITRLLEHEVVSDAELAYRLGCKPELVCRARAALGQEPMPLPPRNARLSREARLVMFSEPLPGGHRRWLGSVSRCGLPVIDGTSVRRIAFRLEYGREPEGHVLPGCVRQWCIAGPHQADQRMRDAEEVHAPARGGRPVDMEARERVAELFRTEGEVLSNIAAAERLGVDRRIVAEVRATLGVPRALGAHQHPKQWTREAFEAQTEVLEGGHRRWRGRHSPDGVPMVGRTESVYRLAFRLHHGRAPEGPVRGGCARKRCVEGSHLTDRLIRASVKAGAR